MNGKQGKSQSKLMFDYLEGTNWKNSFLTRFFSYFELALKKSKSVVILKWTF